MSLPDDWVKRIWDKLTLTYGRDFMARYTGLSEEAVKADWAHELRHFLPRPKAIAHVLENLPVKPPTVAEFKAIAKQWRGPGEALQIDHEHTPVPIPPRLQEALSRLARPAHLDRLQWARDLIDRHEAGDSRPVACVRLAREALAKAGEITPEETAA